MLLFVPAGVFAAATDAAAPPAKSCLGLTRIRSSSVLDARHILFTMNDGSLYLNTLPHRCNGLRSTTPYMYKTSLSQVCDLDTITVLDQVGSGFIRGASCGLGKFEPVGKTDVEMLKQHIAAERAR